MPAIGTSSDQYQHRDPGLTTYRRNTAAPALREAMAERSEDRSKAAAVEPRAPGAGTSIAKTAPERRLADAPVADTKVADTKATTSPVQPEAVTPAKVVHELYAPPSRLKREHDDRFSMITGGTIDVRV